MGFAAFLITQALGAFNDNAFKTFVALFAVATMPAAESGKMIAVAGALFILPFLIFSTFAGVVADRFSKKKLTVLFKAIELVLMALSAVALAMSSKPLLMVLLFLMGMHSAFFGPVKLSILPELVKDEELSNANGLVQATTFLGIILGTVAAGLLLHSFRDRPALAALLFFAVAAGGLGSRLLVPSVTPAAGGDSPLRLNFLSQTWRSVAELHSLYPIYLATVGAAYFWFVGAIFQMNLLIYGKTLMGVSETVASYFQIVVALGIGLGSFLAGRLSRKQVELGLVPLGALGLVLFCIDLAFSFRSTPRTLIDLLLLGMSGGCFAVPLQAFIQHRAPKENLGKIVATGNILSCGAVLLASGWLWAFDDFFKLHPGQIFLATAAMTLAVALYIVWMLPDFFIRLLLYPLANLFYRINVVGRENVPAEGPALLVSNHVSFIDAFLITMANQRLIRFLMFRSYYDLPIAGWFFRAMGCIPISDRDGPKALIESFRAARAALERGEAICIFGEGEISRHGQMLRFKKGFERIVDGLDVPVIPVHLDQVWGSIFSFAGGKVLFKRPRRLPYPVTVSFGTPISSSADAFTVRQAVQEVGADAFRHRLAGRAPLPLSFLREAKRHPLRFAFADSTGADLNYGQALLRAALLGPALADACGRADNVGVLLPPSAAAALANVGLALEGKVPVNLNYTTSQEVVSQCASKASITHIVTSRKFIEKLGWTPTGTLVFIEDAATSISKIGALTKALLLFLLPSALLERWVFPAAAGPLDRLATIMFTSGSTGQPKGVMLTHANILSNIEALAQLYSIGPSDRILGVLPFFHSFGFTVTLWFPLVAGCGAVYHYNPLDAKRIGELAEKHRVTFLLGTPTFLNTYLRRIDPAHFKTLRYAVAGAEKLRAEVAKAFAEKFGLTPLEGYGCTELSPVASVNIPDIDWSSSHQKGTKPGSIGHPLPGIVMKVVHPETRAPLPQGEAGLLLVKGPNVMLGYLGDDAKTAESFFEGFYVTGDIASIDAEGFVTITDRLSRFSKIGGEMVPHVKIEEKLHEAAGILEQTFIVTAVADVQRGERLIVLYREYGDIEGLVKKLQESDLPKLWLPGRDAYHKVDEFPLLGSGKLDMQKLKAVAAGLAEVA
jgi:acyl-[acyl-carrier-protein]-phospholipid O-acyltransferase/long-chain-fatty-acid--[acyl-carrier-protein] ligase